MLKLLKLSLDKKSWMYFLVNTVFSILQVLGYIAVPIMLVYLNEIGDAEYKDTLMPWLSKSTQSTVLMLIMILISLLSFGFGVVSIYYSSKMSTYLANNLRIRVFKKSINFTREDWNFWNKSQVLNLITVDLTYVSNSFEFLFRIVYKTIFMYFGSIVGILVISIGKNAELVPGYPNIPSWSMSVMAILISIIMFLLIILISNYASKHFTKNQESLDSMNNFIENNVNAQKTIKLLNLEEYQLEHFEPLNTNMTKIYTRTGVIQSAILPTIYFFLDISIVLGTWLTPKSMMAELSSLLLFLGLILSSMVSCTLAIININKGISCSKRILEFLNYKYKIVYPTRNLEKIGNELNVKNLKYNYDNFELNVESFSLKDKEKIGIFGLTNSGKSTFINLLTHQLKNNSNSIFVDEENINNFSKNDLSKLYSYCPQNIQLFSGTIKSNLLLANSEANNELMDEILEIVNLNLFSGNNKNSEIGEFGKKLSGGQKQRLMIARTLIKESNIYIFDDCFSALDRITQSEIISRILKLNKTIIIASQKPNLIKNCDKIYVFENGNIIDYGTHEYLMKNCSYYSQSYKEVLLD